MFELKQKFFKIITCFVKIFLKKIRTSVFSLIQVWLWTQGNNLRYLSSSLVYESFGLVLAFLEHIDFLRIMRILKMITFYDVNTTIFIISCYYSFWANALLIILNNNNSLYIAMCQRSHYYFHHHHHHRHHHYHQQQRRRHHQTYSYQFPLDVVMNEIDPPSLLPAVETLLCHPEGLDQVRGHLFQHFQTFLECLVLLDHGVQLRLNLLLPMFHVSNPFTWKCYHLEIRLKVINKQVTSRITKNCMYNK